MDGKLYESLSVVEWGVREWRSRVVTNCISSTPLPSMIKGNAAASNITAISRRQNYQMTGTVFGCMYIKLRMADRRMSE